MNLEHNQTDSVKSKISALRLIAIIGVLYIHAENYAQFGFLSGTNGYDLEQKAIGAFEWAVPLFFLLSAFLFFRGFQWNQLIGKWKRRIHTLLIPYLVWNTIYFILFALLPRLPFLAPYINSAPAQLTLSEIFNSVFLHQYAGVLWFLQALIELTLLAPLFYFVFSRRYIGEAALLVILALSLFRPFALPPVLYLGWRFVFFYALGSYLGLRFPDAVKYTPPRAIRAVLLCALPVIVTLNVLFDYELYSLVFIVCLWLGLSADAFQPRRIYETSFFLYVTHILLFSIIKKIQFAIVPHTEPFMLFAYASVPLFAAAILVPLALLVRRIMPKTYAFLFGGR